MGKAHSNAYRQVGRFFPLEHKVVLTSVCGRDRGQVEDFARAWGYQRTETDWRRLIDQADIDLIDIAAPNHLHAEIALAAAHAGKMVCCEKPLGMDVGQAAQMAHAVEDCRVANMVWFNYRHLPALKLAKRLIDEGRLGRIFHVRSKFLQDWTLSKDVPIGGAGTWRLDASQAGSGVTGDLLTHCIDAALWLNGPISAVSAVFETFVRERRRGSTQQSEAVKIDDAAAFLARFANGALATFEATRYACGHKAQFAIELNGEKGSLAWDLADLNWLRWFDGGDQPATSGWKSIPVSDASHPYMERWWAPGLQIGYEHSFVHQVADFLGGLTGQCVRTPTFRDGWAVDAVAAAVLRSAARALSTRSRSAS